MFRIKICGVASPEDACRVFESGADAIGLNFYPRSLRCITPERASAIAAAATGLLKVGLFVNERPEVVRKIAELVGLDCLQLHGDEPRTHLQELSPWPVFKAFRLGANNLEELVGLATSWLDNGAVGVLIDSLQKPGEFGGGGAEGDWKAAREFVQRVAGPVILAGGLTPSNVAAAITAIQPHGVDTASGVERFPGQKDADAVRRFVAESNRARIGKHPIHREN